MKSSIVNNDLELQATQSSPEKTRILIVDDEKNILSSLSQLLAINYEDYLIGTAESAEEALAIVNSTTVDVLVTDFRLPGMDGLELTRKLHELSPKTRLIMITAYGNEQVIEQAQKNGCTAYLQKPLDVDLLFEFIDEALVPKAKINFELMSFGLANVLLLYELNRTSGVLALDSDRGRGLLVVNKGTIIHAQLGQMRGAEALLALLECTQLDIKSLNCQFIATRTLNVSWLTLTAAEQAANREERLSILRHPKKNQWRNAAAMEPGSNNETPMAELLADFTENKLRAARERRR